MKLRILATATLLAIMGLGMPTQAQTLEPSPPVTPQSPNQLSSDQILEACSRDQADILPNPYSDVSPNHWAYKAVLSLYYCGAYRGAIPLEQVKPYFQQQNPQQSRIHSPNSAESQRG